MNKWRYKIGIITVVLLTVLLCGCEKVQPKTDIEKLAADAAAAMTDGDYGLAAQRYAQLCEMAPGKGENLRALAKAYTAAATGEDAAGQRAQAESTYLSLYAIGAFTEQDYIDLAQLYFDDGNYAAARDMLELCERLYFNETVRAQLESIVVDAAKDSGEIRAAMDSVAALLADADADGLADAAAQNTWRVLLPEKMANGTRCYCYSAAQGELCARITRIAGSDTVELWLLKSDGSMTEFHFGPDAIRFATVAEGAEMNGAYSQIFCDGFTGDAASESGSLSDGVLVGDFVTSFSDGSSAPADLYACWQQHTETDATSYVGSFDAEGHTRLEQQKSATDAGGVVYASAKTAAKTMYLYFYEAEPISADSYVFTATRMGISAWPAWQEGVLLT